MDFVDPAHGPVQLTGRLQESGSDELVLVVHGLGGSQASNYAVAMAVACERAKVDCLRICLRGADRRGGGIYHAGLTADLEGVLASTDLARYRAIRIVGYSMGGHVSLRYILGEHDPRVRCLATVCTPLDLEAGVREIDQPKRILYRWNVLRGLKNIYAASAARGAGLPVPVRQLSSIDTLEDWDAQVVAPTFGFDDARQYWRSQSVHAHLSAIRVPTLAVVTRHDPMVLFHTLEPHLDANPSIERIVLDEGGHVGFPPDVDLGLGFGPGGSGIADQLLGWMRAQ